MEGRWRCAVEFRDHVCAGVLGSVRGDQRRRGRAAACPGPAVSPRRRKRPVHDDGGSHHEGSIWFVEPEADSSGVNDWELYQ